MKKYRLLTFIFDVPVIAIFSYWVIYQFNKTTLSLKGFIISIIFIGIIPLLSWTYLIKHPKDYEGERKMSFIIDIISYPIGLIFLILTKSNKIFIALALSYGLNGLALLIINKLGYKASGHASGITGPSTALTILFGWTGVLSFLFLIPVYLSKLKIKDHTFAQLTVGGLSSALITYLSFAVLNAL